MTAPRKHDGIDYVCRAVVCPTCNAAPGSACTQPTDRARRPVRWTHFARQRLYEDSLWEAENPGVQK